MNNIAPTAIVSENAVLGKNVSIGHFSIIEDNVVIGDNTEIMSHVLICSGTRLGKNCKIFKGAVLGTIPQDLKFGGEDSYLEIGDNNTIREFCTLNRGTKDRGKTSLGNNCLLMAYAHIGHDSDVRNNVIIANSVNLAGHVLIEDFAGIGGDTSIHQYCKVGIHSFTGGGFRIVRDVPPYVLAAGEPLKYYGLNRVGLKRKGFSSETLDIIKKFYSYFSNPDITFSRAFEEIDRNIEKIPEIEHALEFIKSSKRGLIKFKG
ncbi:acyl-ACP--UDP-N-acetylglucosamine O-acyltransferase [candidate division KSB1 bacterium]